MNNIGILSIDQGTTSSRAIVFSLAGQPLVASQQEFSQYFPHNGWVEHDPEEIWSSTVSVVTNALAHAKAKGVEVVTIGITNQRETTVVWNKKTGKPIYKAIVWQDRRTAQMCSDLLSEQSMLTSKTGLLLDPYFSATKLKWILDNVEGARTSALKGELAFGTIDCFLIWRLTGGKIHATDATNASRTNLFNIYENRWDTDLLKLFDIPSSMLPEVKNNADDFGITSTNDIGISLPIQGVAGDQQAALFGQCCFAPGDVKSTYGTGCFALMNTGTSACKSDHRLLTTIGYQLNDQTYFALEGAIFTAGANVQWLRDGIHVIDSAPQTQMLAESLEYDHGVFMVPGFAGLGAPHWNPNARASLFGMTRNTTSAHLARASLEAVCYQTYDLLTAMRNDGANLHEVWVDGGMVANNWLCQFLADILDIKVHRPALMESTALGVAYLAGLKAGLFSNLDEIKSNKLLDQSFESQMPKELRLRLLKKWQLAIEATLTFASD